MKLTTIFVSTMKHFTLLSMALLWSFFLFGQCSVQGIYINSFLADPTGTTNNFDTDGDGTYNTRDEFVQICNETGSTVNLIGFTLSDIVGTKYTFTSSDSILPGECITVISDWINAASIPSYFRELGSGPVWNDGGDSILLSDGTTTCEVSYGSVGSVPESDGCPTININDSAYVDCGLTNSNFNAAPLPVELVFFTGQRSQNNVQLKWRTASEVNNNYFAVERSSDGILFQEIGIINGKGNSQSISDYGFTDYSPVQGVLYYRLKQVDYDANMWYSNIIYVNSDHENMVVHDSGSELVISVMEEEIATVRVLNSNGQELISDSFYESYTLAKDQLQNGMYHVLVCQKDKMISYKLMIF